MTYIRPFAPRRCGARHERMRATTVSAMILWSNKNKRFVESARPQFGVSKALTAEYHRMVDCGALEQARVELADGVLVESSPQSEPTEGGPGAGRADRSPESAGAAGCRRGVDSGARHRAGRASMLHGSP